MIVAIESKIWKYNLFLYLKYKVNAKKKTPKLLKPEILMHLAFMISHEKKLGNLNVFFTPQLHCDIGLKWNRCCLSEIQSSQLASVRHSLGSALNSSKFSLKLQEISIYGIFIISFHLFYFIFLKLSWKSHIYVLIHIHIQML